jgi:anti-sigma-K factor RskA
MVHENYNEMLSAHALTALDADDLRTLEEHLATCGECPAELDEWNAAVATLAFASLPAEPSARVRDQILESIRTERSAPSSASEERREEIPTVIPFPERQQVWNSTQRFGALAAGLALVALLIGTFVLWKQNRSAQAEIARLSAERDAAQHELNRQRSLVELLTKRGASLAVLSGTPQAPNAQATLTYDRQTGNAVLLANGLPPAPAGKAYQLWFIVGKSPMPGRVFATDRTGKAILNDQVPSEALKTAIFAITLEPEGGVKAPTGPIYLVSAS